MFLSTVTVCVDIRGYTATDILARDKTHARVQRAASDGMGRVGLPAERHAVRTGEHPAIITGKNCDTFRRRVSAWVCLMTGTGRSMTDPGYYKWTQFFRFYTSAAWPTKYRRRKLVSGAEYRAGQRGGQGWQICETSDPSRKAMRQWMLKITGMRNNCWRTDGLDWPEGIRPCSANG